MKKHRKLWIVLGSIIGLLLTIVIAFTVYVNIYYGANEEALEVLTSTDDVQVKKQKHCYIFEPEQYDTGIVFYPGGKVQEESYAPLMYQFAQQGILTILVEMPFRLAVLGMNRADGLTEQFSKVEHWYMAGHSLGGSMAASYVSKHQNSFEGLILLAAYSTADLRETNLKVFSVYGENDGVLNPDKYQKNYTNLPQDSTYEYVIPGGCHAYFGNYGHQKKDGTPTITPAEQQQLTISFILKYI